MYEVLFDYLDRVDNLNLSFVIGVSETGMVVKPRASDEARCL